jgi:pimeloyl-ACP methyl ester carboxylesterase
MYARRLRACARRHGRVSRALVQDAADGAALLGLPGYRAAHVFALSFSGAIAIQLASAAPERVRTLTLIEPPPVHVPSAAAFRTANTRLLEIRRVAGVGAALVEFLTMLVGPQSRTEVERGLPGSESWRRGAHQIHDQQDLDRILRDYVDTPRP